MGYTQEIRVEMRGAREVLRTLMRSQLECRVCQQHWSSGPRVTRDGCVQGQSLRWAQPVFKPIFQGHQSKQEENTLEEGG